MKSLPKLSYKVWTLWFNTSLATAIGVTLAGLAIEVSINSYYPFIWLVCVIHTILVAMVGKSIRE